MKTKTKKQTTNWGVDTSPEGLRSLKHKNEQIAMLKKIQTYKLKGGKWLSLIQGEKDKILFTLSSSSRPVTPENGVRIDEL